MRSVRVEFVMSEEEVAELDRLRGRMSRGAYLRGLVSGVREGGVPGGVGDEVRELEERGLICKGEHPMDISDVSMDTETVSGDVRRLIVDVFSDETPDDEVDFGQLNSSARRLLKNEYEKLVEDKASDGEFEKLARKWKLIEDEKVVDLDGVKFGSTDRRETDPIDKKSQTYWKKKKKKSS